MNWDTYEETIESISKRIRPIVLRGRTKYVLATLFDNRSFAGLINAFGVENDCGGSYLFFNDFNPALPIVRDRVQGRYLVREGMDNHPIAGVNWPGAKLLCSILGGRLLTGQEWESVASSGKKARLYPWGSEAPDEKRCNFGENVGTTTPIFCFPPNEWEFYDMAGNLEEWCQDSHPDDAELKLVKGGSFNKEKGWLRIKAKRYKWGRLGAVGIGFRVCWDEFPTWRTPFNG